MAIKKQLEEEERFLMTSEVARILNRSSSAVIGYARTGKLPVIKTANGHRLFKLRDVMKLAAELERAE